VTLASRRGASSTTARLSLREHFVGLAVIVVDMVFVHHFVVVEVQVVCVVAAVWVTVTVDTCTCVTVTVVVLAGSVTVEVVVVFGRRSKVSFDFATVGLGLAYCDGCSGRRCSNGWCAGRC